MKRLFVEGVKYFNPWYVTVARAPRSMPLSCTRRVYTRFNDRYVFRRFDVAPPTRAGDAPRQRGSNFVTSVPVPFPAAASPRAPSHAVRRLEILDTAARVFNRDGLTNTSLDEVAKQLGTSKASLYYYVKNKEDLIFQCYLRACEMGFAHLQRAARDGQTGLERVDLYIRYQTLPGNPPAAVLSEVGFLSEEHQSAILRASRANDELLRGFIREGIDDGSIAPGDVTLTNFALMGTFAWISVWRRDGRGRATEAEVARVFLDFFVNGLRPAEAPRLPIPEVPEPAPSAPVDMFARDEVLLAKRTALLKAAAAYFNRGGYDGTSLDEIVASLGVTKGAFYYYFENKEDLLFQCYSRSLDLAESRVRDIASMTGSGLEKIQHYIYAIIHGHSGPDGPFAIYTRVRSLSQSRQRQVLARGKALQLEVQRFIEQGIADGSIRRCDPRMARLAVVGALNWMPKWFAPLGPKSAAEVGRAFADFFTNGLAQGRSQAVQSATA